MRPVAEFFAGTFQNAFERLFGAEKLLLLKKLESLFVKLHLRLFGGRVGVGRQNIFL
jgi:hypothetical protein